MNAIGATTGFEPADPIIHLEKARRGQRHHFQRRREIRAERSRQVAQGVEQGDRRASQRAVFSASSARMDTPQDPAARTASWKRAIFSAQNSTRGGSSDTDVNALTVIAWPALVVTTTMPPGNWPAARRKAAWSTSLTCLPLASASSQIARFRRPAPFA